MRIAIYVEKNAAMLAGHDRHGWMIVDVPAAAFSDAQRAILATTTNNSFRTSAVSGQDYTLDYDALAVAEATPATVIATLDAMIQQRAAKCAEYAATLEQAITRYAALPLADRVSDDGYGHAGAHKPRMCQSMPYLADSLQSAVLADPRGAAAHAEAVAEATRLNATHAERVAAVRAENEAHARRVAEARTFLAAELARRDERIAEAEGERDIETTRANFLASIVAALPADALAGVVKQMAAEKTAAEVAELRARIERAAGIADDDESDDESDDE